MLVDLEGSRGCQQKWEDHRSVYILYIYCICFILFFPPPFFIKRYICLKATVFSASKNHGAKKNPSCFPQVDQLVQDRWHGCFGSQLASENLIRAVHHFFSRRKNMVKRGCNATWGFQDFFWTVLALRIVTLQKVQRISCRAILWLVDWTTPKFNQEVLWVTTNGIFAATQKESHCYNFWTLVSKDLLLILKVSIIMGQFFRDLVRI